MKMRAWPAIIGAPLLVLADQTIAYAFVAWSCSHQAVLPLHAVHAVFLLLILATAVSPWRRLDPGAAPSAAVEELERRNFFSLLGVLSAGFSALVVVAMWIPQWYIAPCLS